MKEMKVTLTFEGEGQGPNSDKLRVLTSIMCDKHRTGVMVISETEDIQPSVKFYECIIESLEILMSQANTHLDEMIKAQNEASKN